MRHKLLEIVVDMRRVFAFRGQGRICVPSQLLCGSSETDLDKMAASRPAYHHCSLLSLDMLARGIPDS